MMIITVWQCAGCGKLTVVKPNNMQFHQRTVSNLQQRPHPMAFKRRGKWIKCGPWVEREAKLVDRT